MTGEPLSPEFLEFLRTIRCKRSRIVVNHILEYGFITTEELENRYGYKHPPRAIRDVREQGVPIETFTVKNTEGQSIAAYRFGDPAEALRGRVGGRQGFPKHFKTTLYERQRGCCAICLQAYEPRYLQVDHRIPYLVAGEGAEPVDLSAYMLICGSCSRAKSWSCEHCENGISQKKPQICKACYWANPSEYAHIALRPIRRLDIVWAGEEINDFEDLKRLAEANNRTMPDYVKEILKRVLNGQ